MPLVYVSPRKEVKRPKKNGANKGVLFEGMTSKEAEGVDEGKDTNAGSAGSLEECRRAQ